VNVPVDVIPSDSDISKYDVIIMPQMIIGKPEFTKRVRDFVTAGGTAVLTYRNAVKDIHNNLTFGEAVPVGYSDFAGVTVVETESIQPGQEFPVVGASVMEGEKGEGTIYRELLEVADAEVLFNYGDEFYSQYAAVTRKKQGKGTVYYLGCGLDEETEKQLMNVIMKDTGIEPIESADGVEICFRGEGENKVRMIMNHNGYEVNDGDIHLAPYESRIEKA
jgi:beta-galactosidase